MTPIFSASDDGVGQSRRQFSKSLLIASLAAESVWPHSAASGTQKTLPPITTLAFTPDGDTLLSGSQAGLASYRWQDVVKRTGSAKARQLGTELSHIHDLAFSPDNSKWAAVGGSPGDSGGIEIRQWPTKETVVSILVGADLIYAVAWLDDSHLATGGEDGVVRLWHFNGTGPQEKLKQYGELRGHSRGINTLCPVANNNSATPRPPVPLLLSGAQDSSLRVWKHDEVASRDQGPASYALRRTLSNHTRPVLALAQQPPQDGLAMVVSTGEDRTVRFWQPQIGRLVRFKKFQRAIPLQVAWLDPVTVVTACSDGHVRVIDAESLRIITDQPALKGWAYALAVHPKSDSPTVAVAGQFGELRALVVPEIERGD